MLLKNVRLKTALCVTLKNIRLRSDMSTSALTKKIFYNTISYIIFLKDKMRPHLDIKDFYLFFITDNV